jgi:hypothetical protein
MKNRFLQVAEVVVVVVQDLIQAIEVNNECCSDVLNLVSLSFRKSWWWWWW